MSPANPSILVVYPHNPWLTQSGINTRTRQLLAFLTRRNLEIDLLSLTHFADPWPKRPPLRTPEITLNHLRLYNFRRRPGFWRQRLFPSRTPRPDGLPDYAFPSMKRLFHRMLRDKAYDMVLVSYVHWAGLVAAPLPDDATPVTGSFRGTGAAARLRHAIALEVSPAND